MNRYKMILINMHRFFFDDMNGLQPVVRCGVVIFGFAFLGGCRDSPPTRIAEIRSLSRNPTPAEIQRIAEALADPDRDVRATSLVVLAEVDPTRARPLAMGALGDPDGVVRAAAVRTVARALDPELVDRLAALGPSDPVWQVRDAVLEALTASDGEKVRAAYERGAQDPVAHVRKTALEVAASRPGLLPTAVLAAVLKGDDDWENRVLAAKILGASQDPEAYAPLDEAVGDPHEFVRAAATRERLALVRGGTPRPSPPPATPSPSPTPAATKPRPGV